jgi:hypothetical protein
MTAARSASVASRKLDLIAFARRQSPDWASLSADYRAGRRLDPARFVPAHPIAGFPPHIDRLIAEWNSRFAIDFFTCRAVIGSLSRNNLAQVRHAAHFTYRDVAAICALAARQRFVVFFHDDDDFFAEYAYDRIADTAVWEVDTCVFPLFRVHTELFTLARRWQKLEFVWGRRKAFNFRFQSNNYGISSRICSEATLRAMKDHVEASRFADRAKLSGLSFSFPISATVKTPCAASVIGDLVDDERQFRRDMVEFAERFHAPELPNAYAWLRTPLSLIAELFRTVASGRGYDALPIDPDLRVSAPPC